METLTVTNDMGRKFTVRILRSGDKYGLDECLTWGEKTRGIIAPEDLAKWNLRLGLEFYDATYAGDQRFPPLGQFVSLYYLGSILEGHGGVDLQGDVPEWKIDHSAMAEVLAWVLKSI